MARVAVAISISYGLYSYGSCRSRHIYATCLCTCLYTCLHIHVYTYDHAHIYRCVYTHVYTHVFPPVCTGVHTHYLAAYLCAYPCAHVYARGYAHFYAHVHTHVYTHTLHSSAPMCMRMSIHTLIRMFAYARPHRHTDISVCTRAHTRDRTHAGARLSVAYLQMSIYSIYRCLFIVFTDVYDGRY